MRFTAGPWEVVEFEDCYPGIDAWGHSIVILGEQRSDNDGGIRGRTSEETRANAQLIAAAPHMVDALEQARAALAAQLDRIDAALGKAGM